MSDTLDLTMDGVIDRVDYSWDAGEKNRLRYTDSPEVFYAKYGDIIRKVARREHKQATTITREDLEQELFTFFLSRLGSVWGFSNEGVEGMAVKAARSIMLKERLDYMYFHGTYIYTPTMIETYLEDAVWHNVEDVPDIDGRVDVTGIVQTLPLETQRLLFKKYALGENPHREDHQARKVIERAVDDICHQLNLGAKVKRTPLENAD